MQNVHMADICYGCKLEIKIAKKANFSKILELFWI